ncbi:MCE family protein [Mycobacterium sp. Aquia_216]|uniref:MCE family protein n=1 Tax=Mycobacterium sp. Aquia_216 TaxID=2991729 RepID=UPI00227A1C2D|nr:MCE family protein [Mycobacterium sp. Aquia_216]WAJ44324.1 MCE family protein [Mycobacterium sp. Aquia_216]
MKTFAERNPLVVGAVGAAMAAVLVVGSLEYDKIPFVNSDESYSAYFAEAGGLASGAAVRVSGMRVGQVSSIVLDGPRVLVKFTVDKDVHLGERTEAAIKTKTLLGAKILELVPRGEGNLSATIPLERTTAPYQLPDALGDLTKTISGLNTTQLSDSLTTLAQTFSKTPPDVKVAVDGIARLSQTMNSRDEQLRRLLDNARKSTDVLAHRADQVVNLVRDTNALLAELRTQSDGLQHISSNISALANQLEGLISENKAPLKPALDKLNDLLGILDNRKHQVQRALTTINNFLPGLAEAVASGPYFNSYIVNILPGQFLQPFIDAAFSDLGLDPNVLAPSQLSDPQVGQKATPPMPVPFPRTGQGGEPRLNLPDAITGNPGDPRYPYRQPPPAPAPGGPPPGPPALPPPGQSVPPLGPTPVYVPAPNEVPPPHQPTPGASQ